MTEVMMVISFKGGSCKSTSLIKQNFTIRLNWVLQFDPRYAVLGEQVIDSVEDLTSTALQYGARYIDEVEIQPLDRHFIGYAIFRSERRIAQQRSFTHLLRECDRHSREGVQLRDIEDQATLIGRMASRYLMKMMVVTSIEERKDMVKHFRDTQTMLSFLTDVFDWDERGDDFGVVYKRINLLMKHAHKEFILQVKTEEMAGGVIRDIPSLELDLIESFESKINRDVLLDYILKEILQAISILESLLSFPLLPDRAMLLTAGRRSIAWLNAAVVNVGERLRERVGYKVRALTSAYVRHQNFRDANAFISRMNQPIAEVWADLEGVVEVSAGFRSRGRIRLHVRGTIIQQFRDTALIRIRGINSRNEAERYVGKRVVYFYKENLRRSGSRYSHIRGKVTKPYMDSGILHARFRSLLPREGWLSLYMYRPTLKNMFGRIVTRIDD